MTPRMLLALLCATTIAGCASSPPASTAANASALPGTAACIFSVNITGWEVLDNQTLLVQAPLSRDTYLIRLFAPMTELPFKEQLAFIDGDHNNQICSNGDELAIGGPIRDHVPITAVRRLTMAEANQLRTLHGKPVVKPAG